MVCSVCKLAGHNKRRCNWVAAIEDIGFTLRLDGSLRCMTCGNKATHPGVKYPVELCKGCSDMFDAAEVAEYKEQQAKIEDDAPA